MPRDNTAFVDGRQPHLVQLGEPVPTAQDSVDLGAGEVADRSRDAFDGEVFRPLCVLGVVVPKRAQDPAGLADGGETVLVLGWAGPVDIDLDVGELVVTAACLLYTSPSPRD